MRIISTFLLIIACVNAFAIEVPLYRKGIEAYTLGEYRQAIEFLKESVQEEPLGLDYLENSRLYLGFAYSKLGLYEEGLQQYEKVLLINPRNEKASCGLGSAQLQLSRYEASVEEFSRIISIYPRASCAYHGRARVHGILQEWELAVDDFSRTLNIDYRNAAAFMGRGASFFSLGKYAEALEDFEEAILINPGHAFGYSGAGFSSYITKNYSSAFAYFNQAIGKLFSTDNDYIMFMYLASEFQGEDGINSILYQVKAADLAIWPGKILQYFTGEIGIEELKHSWEQESDTQVREERECMVNFAIAEIRFLKNIKDSTKELYLSCIK